MKVAYLLNGFHSWRMKIEVPALPPALSQGGKEVVLRERTHVYGASCSGDAQAGNGGRRF